MAWLRLPMAGLCLGGSSATTCFIRWSGGGPAGGFGTSLTSDDDALPGPHVSPSLQLGFSLPLHLGSEGRFFLLRLIVQPLARLLNLHEIRPLATFRAYFRA